MTFHYTPRPSCQHAALSIKSSQTHMQITWMQTTNSVVLLYMRHELMSNRRPCNKLFSYTSCTKQPLSSITFCKLCVSALRTLCVLFVFFCVPFVFSLCSFVYPLCSLCVLCVPFVFFLYNFVPVL